VYMQFRNGPDMGTFGFTFDIEETVNEPDPVDDIITFPGDFSPEPGTTYLELLGFGTDTQNLVNYFESEEGGLNSILLWGRLVPEPSTLLLLGLGTLAFLRRRSR